MDRLSVNSLYEILKYVSFRDMNYLRTACKKHSDKVKTVMIILSEREANRILLSSSDLLRNPFIDYEEPQMKLSNESWYDFLIDQISQRWRIKK